MSKRITTITFTALFLLSSCNQTTVILQSPTEKTPIEQVDPTLAINNTEIEEESTTISPTYTPTQIEVTPTTSPTPRPTKTLPPTETPTPRPTVDLRILPGEIGKNYFYFPYRYFEEEGMQTISFVSGELLDVAVEGEYVVVSIRTRMRDKEVILKSKTKGFNLFNENIDTVFGGTEEGYYKYITTENIDEVPVGIEIRPDFLYTMIRMPEVNKDRALITCKGNYMDPGSLSARRSYTPVCANMDALYVDGVGKLSADDIAEWFEGKDLSNVDFDLAVLTDIAYGRPNN